MIKKIPQTHVGRRNGKENLKLYYKDNNTESLDCQVDKILRKAMLHKGYNKKVIDWLESEGQFGKAENLRECATMIGVTDVDGIAHVT